MDKAGALGDFARLQSKSPAAVLFGSHGCEALYHSPTEEGWQFGPLGPSSSSNRTISSLPLPHDWRVVSVAKASCQVATSPCEALWLAGWDGAEILVAAAQRDSQEKFWPVMGSLKL